MGLSSHHLYTLWSFVAPVTQQGDLLLQKAFPVVEVSAGRIKKKKDRRRKGIKGKIKIPNPS